MATKNLNNKHANFIMLLKAYQPKSIPAKNIYIFYIIFDYVPSLSAKSSSFETKCMEFFFKIHSFSSNRISSIHPP